jgi:hypothetical protein
VILARVGGDEPGAGWYFEDFARRKPMLLLAVIFAAAVALLGRWRGVFSLVGLLFSLVLLVRFVLPSILEGHDPVAVAVVGAAAVMFVALYLAHGFNIRTTSAVAGTVASLLLIGVLSNVFVSATHLTGLASEEGEFLRVLAGNINLHGLLLGGIVIGSLGVSTTSRSPRPPPCGSSPWPTPHLAPSVLRFAAMVGSARVVTLLFTDLVGSTELLQRLGDDAAEELRHVHFSLVRQALTTAGGDEVKTLGDGLMAVFASPVQAVRCAVEVQRAIEEHNRKPSAAVSPGLPSSS